eukprot:Gb_34550 [translate_table: standard]
MPTLQEMWMELSPQVLVFTLFGGVVSWRSKKQEMVAQSTIEAEYIAVAEASKEAVWIQLLCNDVGVHQGSVQLWCDNKSAIDLAENPKFHAITKHIKVRFHFIKEMIEDGEICLQKVKTEKNVADALMKVVSTQKFVWCQGKRSLTS